MNSYFYFIREAIPDNSDYFSESELLRDFLNDPSIDVEKYISSRNAEEELLITPVF